MNVRKKYYTGKIHQCLDDHPHEGTLISSGAPVWHHSVPACVTVNKSNATYRSFILLTELGTEQKKICFYMSIYTPYLWTYLAVCSLVKYRVWPTILLLKTMNERHNISYGVCHTTTRIWPDEPQGKPIRWNLKKDIVPINNLPLSSSYKIK